MSEHIIEVRGEDERRQHQRRREDQVRTLEQAADLLSRERRYALLQAAAILARNLGPGSEPWYVEQAERLLAEIERRERERQGKDETK